jgi:hypothetical protein
MKNILFSIFAVMMLAACGQVPGAFKGTYEDKEKGAKLELQQSEWKLTTADGRVLQAKVEALDVESLKAGKDGVYVLENPTNKTLLDVFFAHPNVSSKQEASGLIWYESELAYTLIDKDQKEPAAAIDFFHCLKGLATIDSVTSRWELGCPAGATTYHLVRVNQ